MRYTEKGRSVFARRDITRGDFICKYDGELLCTYKDLAERHEKYNLSGEGSYILEFKFCEKRWAIDATKDDNTFGRLINHAKRFKNVKPVVGKLREGTPFVYFVAIKNILKDEEILYDYCDNSTMAKNNFPWLRKEKVS